ncbi:MAG TPA: response regulator [Myxococcota bacterium]|nr:response regulator [Myxococcota bacterium]
MHLRGRRTRCGSAARRARGALRARDDLRLLFASEQPTRLGNARYGSPARPFTGYARLVEAPGKATILVADDEPMLLRLVERILTVNGFRVFTASDGEKAVAQLQAAEDTAPVQAVVLDLAMPPEGGAKALDRLLALRPQLGVVVTSGVQPEPGLRALLEARGGVFLQKPFAPDALLHAVENALAARPAGSSGPDVV